MINLPVTELLAGLAEEASELAQVALKLRRVLDGTNPTPMDEKTARDNLIEEVADLSLYFDKLSIDHDIIDLNKMGDIKMYKNDRWCKRLGGGKQIPGPRWSPLPKKENLK